MSALVTLITCFIISKVDSNQPTSQENCLPKSCHHLSTTTRIHSGVSTSSIICGTQLTSEDAQRLSTANKSCPFMSSRTLVVNINPKFANILNDSFRILTIGRHIQSKPLRTIDFYLHESVTSLDIDSKFNILNNVGGNSKYGYVLNFDNFFTLVNQTGQRVSSCQDLSKNPPFQLVGPNWFISVNNRHSELVCPLVFRNARLQGIALSYQINSFFRQNVVRFINQSELPELNSKMLFFRVFKAYQLDLDASILHPGVFSNVYQFDIQGEVRSIDELTFRPFRLTNLVRLNMFVAMKISRRQGIGWIKNMNPDVNVNLTDPDDFGRNRDRIMIIELYISLKTYLSQMDALEMAQEADFCLFADFPFNQMVFFNPKSERKRIPKLVINCPTAWLVRYHDIVPRTVGNRLYKNRNKSFFDVCDFEKRLKLCSKGDFQLPAWKKPSRGFTDFDIILIVDLILIFLAPVISLYGIFTNIAVIRVISGSTMNEKHYKYMKIHSLANVVVLVIEMTSLMSECQIPFGLYCSSIRRYVGVQYLRIVLGEYLSCVFRLISSFAYVGFSVSRLSRVGKEHSKVTQFVADLDIKVLMGVCTVTSFALSVAKALRFKINSSRELMFPIPFDMRDSDWRYHNGYVAIMALVVVYDLLSYVGFVIVNLVIDMSLVVALRAVLKEREEKFNAELIVNEQMRSKMEKENEESKRRVLTMVVINSLVNLGSKIPMTVTSINDVRIHASVSIRLVASSFTDDVDWFSFSLLFGYFCNFSKGCLVFQSMSSCLYKASLSLNLFFLKRFDKNFHLAYRKMRGLGDREAKNREIKSQIESENEKTKKEIDKN